MCLNVVTRKKKPKCSEDTARRQVRPASPRVWRRHVLFLLPRFFLEFNSKPRSPPQETLLEKSPTSRCLPLPLPSLALISERRCFILGRLSPLWKSAGIHSGRRAGGKGAGGGCLSRQTGSASGLPGEVGASRRGCCVSSSGLPGILLQEEPLPSLPLPFSSSFFSPSFSRSSFQEPFPSGMWGSSRLLGRSLCSLRV